MTSLFAIFLTFAVAATGLSFVQYSIAHGIAHRPRLRWLLLTEAAGGHLLLAFYVFGILFRGMSNETDDVLGGPLLLNWFLVIAAC
jgi:hypothetical protein